MSPDQYDSSISFQVVSDEDAMENKKIGDPMGYCLAWSLWYLEMRISNPQVHPLELIRRSLSLIITNQKNREIRTSVFIDFIRDYTNNLDKEKNDLLMNLGFDKNKIYNMSEPNDDIKKNITLKFKQLIK